MRPRTVHMLSLVGLTAIAAVARAEDSQTTDMSGPQACAALKKRMALYDHVATADLDKTWFCDITNDDYGAHPEWWVIGLRSFRQCEGICSNLRGWFAVNRKTGEVREWNTGEDELGGPIGSP
jgi:hypothetical protein